MVCESGASVDPPQPGMDAQRPEVRSEFVRWLAADPEAASNIYPKGLRVWGVSLQCKLDFEECHILPTLYLHQCTLKNRINLMEAEIKGLHLTESDVSGRLQGDGITVHGPIDFRGSTFSSEVSLLGASIASELSCVDTKFGCSEDALSRDAATIGGIVLFNYGFESCGMIWMLGTRIVGSIECQDAKFKTSGIALSMDGARSRWALILFGWFQATVLAAALSNRFKM